MRYLLLLFSLSASLLVSAQTKEYPFVEEGKRWVMQISHLWHFDDPTETSTKHYSLRGDTIIRGIVAKKFFCDDYPDSISYEGAFYEEDNKLYFCEEHSDSFLLLFDCDAKVGDSINITTGDYIFPDYNLPFLQTVHIDSVQPTDTQSSRRKFFMRRDWRTIFREVEDHTYHFDIGTGGSWIEGVGRPYGAHATPHETWYFIYIGGATARMVSCTVGNRVEYLLTGITTLTTENNPTADTYYSIDGRRLTAPPARGVYLHNGRKVMK